MATPDSPEQAASQSSSVTGYGPAALQKVYEPSLDSSGGVVAIVDAFDDPNALTDLTVYRSSFGLPICETQSGCFRKVNEKGKTSPLPLPDPFWAAEISLDLDMVSAACPHCEILLVEAESASIDDLALAVDEAVSSGAVAVANSYGVPEWPTEQKLASHYDHPGVTITASAGDGGFGTQFPAVVPTVVSVGGTTLQIHGNTADETVWAATGSGCSQYEPKPRWQTDRGCKFRTQNDLAVVANPNTGVWAYDSYQTVTSWQVWGGTSIGSAFVAGMAAAANSNQGGESAATLYEHSSSLYDVTQGNNGICQVSYLCSAEVGYDGPSGLGAPRGFTVFGP